MQGAARHEQRPVAADSGGAGGPAGGAARLAPPPPGHRRRLLRAAAGGRRPPDPALPGGHGGAQRRRQRGRRSDREGRVRAGAGSSPRMAQAGGGGDRRDALAAHRLPAAPGHAASGESPLQQRQMPPAGARLPTTTLPGVRCRGRACIGGSLPTHKHTHTHTAHTHPTAAAVLLLLVGSRLGPATPSSPPTSTACPRCRWLGRMRRWWRPR